MAKSTTPVKAASAAFVAWLLLFPVLPASAWSEFGTKEEEEVDILGPEIREPFFEFLLNLAIGDSVGLWTGDDLRAQVADSERESRFPVETVVSIRRARPVPEARGKYPGMPVKAVWTLTLTSAQDNPMPYSILGYHPGSLRIAREMVFSELGPADLTITYEIDDEKNVDLMTEVRLFCLEQGSVVLDADGWLDALLGSGLDDAWTLGFVIGRQEGKLVGLGVSLGRDERRIFGEFDFTQDKVLAHGRPPMAALSRASRRWLNVESGNLPEPWVEP